MVLIITFCINKEYGFTQKFDWAKEELLSKIQKCIDNALLIYYLLVTVNIKYIFLILVICQFILHQEKQCNMINYISHTCDEIKNRFKITSIPSVHYV